MKLAVLAGERVDDLLVAPGAERDGDEGLGFASGKQGRTMGARQHADPRADRTHGARVAAVDARLAVEDLAAHDLRFEVEVDFLELVRVDLDADLPGFLGELLGGGLADLDKAGVARLLLPGAEGLAHVVLGELGDAADERLVLRRGLPFPCRLARDFGELVDRLDGSLHLLVAEGHRAEHHILGQLEGLRLHHHHALLGACDHQVQLRLLELGHGGVEHVLSIEVADAARADGAVERNAGDGEGGGDGDHRRDVGVDLGVERQHLGHDLHFVVEAVREQRADRAVDEARGQRFLFRGPAFALEEAAGDLARRVGLLGIVDRQREEVLPGLGFPGEGHGGEDHGIVHGAHHGAVRLARDLAGFEANLMTAVGKRLLDGIQGESFVGMRKQKAPIGSTGA
jgi:hypothetical protein